MLKKTFRKRDKHFFIAVFRDPSLPEKTQSVPVYALIRGDCPNPTFWSKRRRQRAPRCRLGLRKGSLESLKGDLEAFRTTFALHATHAYFCL